MRHTYPTGYPPPVTVFFDGDVYWLADGFHRAAAHVAAKPSGVISIDCDVRQGTQRDAILYSVGANATNGLRRSNADKQRAVKRLLDDPEWAAWSNVEIAKRCGVSEITVRRLRPIIDNVEDTPRTCTRNGTTYTQKVRTQPAPEPEDELPPWEDPPKSATIIHPDFGSGGLANDRNVEAENTEWGREQRGAVRSATRGWDEKASTLAFSATSKVSQTKHLPTSQSNSSSATRPNPEVDAGGQTGLARPL